MLEIELVPSTCWYSNVRSEVSRADWEKCKQYVRERSGNRCEVCGGQGRKWAVECHEIWEYDDDNFTQTLRGLIALCPPCHRVKHIGRTLTVGTVEDLEQSIRHLCEVNYWTPEHAEMYINAAFDLWKIRSQYEWSLDISWLDTLGIKSSSRR